MAGEDQRSLDYPPPDQRDDPDHRTGGRGPQQAAGPPRHPRERVDHRLVRRCLQQPPTDPGQAAFLQLAAPALGGDRIWTRPSSGISPPAPEIARPHRSEVRSRNGLAAGTPLAHGSPVCQPREEDMTRGIVATGIVTLALVTGCGSSRSQDRVVVTPRLGPCGASRRERSSWSSAPTCREDTPTAGGSSAATARSRCIRRHPVLQPGGRADGISGPGRLPAGREVLPARRRRRAEPLASRSRSGPRGLTESRSLLS